MTGTSGLPAVDCAHCSAGRGTCQSGSAGAPGGATGTAKVPRRGLHRLAQDLAPIVRERGARARAQD
eukprot:7686233-Pyramimonas_sp.AAC.1